MADSPVIHRDPSSPSGRSPSGFMRAGQRLLSAGVPRWRPHGGSAPSVESGSLDGATSSADVMASDPLKVVYLGVTGVLHPSCTLYNMVHGRSPWGDGHHEYEAVPVLEAALAGWPDVKIVLTATQTWTVGLEPVLMRLGQALSCRVVGYTYEDLTTKVRFGPRQLTLSANGYRRMTRSEVVRAHVEWLQPSAWIAIDDETTFWTVDERRAHLVATDGCEGLLEPSAQDRLMTLLVGTFGAPNPTDG